MTARMTPHKRPWSVAAVAILYVITGTAGFAQHLHSIVVARSLPVDLLLAELTELAAIVSGVFLLRGARWAQWLALVWIAFHVAISTDSLLKTTVHGVLLMVIAWGLFHREARAFFQGAVQTAA